jgi:hypothetical protein
MRTMCGRLVAGEAVAELARSHGLDVVDHSYHVTEDAKAAHATYSQWVAEDRRGVKRGLDDTNLQDTGMLLHHVCCCLHTVASMNTM